jgi:hypothetical protein
LDFFMRYILLALPLLFTACASDRFGTYSPIASQPPVISSPPPTIYQQNPNADLELPVAKPLPIAPIQTEPLAGAPTLPTLPTDKPPVVAALAPVPAVPAIPRPNIGALGTWSVKDTDGTCRLTLTSQSFFDYQRANSTCKGASLAKVNAWEKKGSEIILYEPGGKIAARLNDQGGSYAGSTSKGAEIRMSR